MSKQKSSGSCGTAFILVTILYAIGQFIEENYIKILIIIGVIIFIIAIGIIINHQKAKSATQSSTSESTIDDYVSNLKYSQAQHLLDRAKRLTNTLNTTTNRSEFYTSFDELNNVLVSLTKLEGSVKFSGVLPSDDLKKINAQKQASIDLLEQRIKESKNQIQTDSDIVPKLTPEAEIKETLKIHDNFKAASKVSSERNSKIDPYFEEAGRFIIENERASIGKLQRLFDIGFNRAARIMDQLCDAGVVGPQEGSSPRKVLMTMSQFEDFLSDLENVDDISTVFTAFNSYTAPCPNPPEDRLQMYNGKYDYMEGHDFERFCAKLLEANGFSNVNVTPGSNDQGIDILAEKQDVKYAIQCKRYSSDVGNKAVQEVFAGKSYYGCHVGVVLTNRYFTSSAKELAAKTQIFLWDRNVLNSLCENYYEKSN
jgi:hypothetical protein